MGGEPRGHRSFGHRARDEVPLGAVAAERPQGEQLARLFDAFSDDDETEHA
ncbi:MAG TPA: hypothetical protein VIN74_05175 [Candidatus Limnocylindria bacterium]